MLLFFNSKKQLQKTTEHQCHQLAERLYYIDYIMDILTEKASAEIIVKKSRFLAELLPCDTPQKAREILKAQKEKYRDATHVVHAFVCGPSAESCGASDDGEPSGTAGKPVLAVLKGRGSSNVFLSVTRWFGGTLLGTGGLVKAYSDAAKAALVTADENHCFETYVAKQFFSMQVNYTHYEKIKQLLKQFTVYDMTEKFADGVDITLATNKLDAEKFAVAIKDATGGQVMPLQTD